MFSVTPPIVAPVMLYQLVVLAPIAFVVLDVVEIRSSAVLAAGASSSRSGTR